MAPRLFRYSCCPSRCTESLKKHDTAPSLCQWTPRRSGGFPVRNCRHSPPNLRTNYWCRHKQKQSRQGGGKACVDHLCPKLYLSQSNPPEGLASNKLTQLVPVLWMASATVYLVLPRAHLWIFAILRSDWRKRWSRLSDNNKGVWRTLREETQAWRWQVWPLLSRHPTELRGFHLMSELTSLKTPANLSFFGKHDLCSSD